jgi:hypothetical protein
VAGGLGGRLIDGVTVRGVKHVQSIESRSYLGNQTQQQLQGPQVWMEQVADEQST